MTDWLPIDEDVSARLDGLAAALLPGHQAWPGGDSLGLGRRMVLRAADSARFRAAIQAFVALREPGLAAGARAEERVDALRALQAGEPELFGLVTMSAYDAYYTHPQILELMGERAGIGSAAPQPEGHVLRVEPYHDTARVRDAGIRWRDDHEPIARSVRAAQEAEPGRVWSEEEITSWSKS